jgi:SAM-dependent methyltransferase
MSDPVFNKQTSTNLDFSATAELYANERCLKNYCADIIKKITKGLSRSISLQKQNSNLEILEFGAGIGTLATEYAAKNGLKPDCVEIDPTQAQIIKDRGYRCFSDLSELQKKYDAIYTSNVLEHIEDDSGSIKRLYGCLKPGGGIAIYVPAFMCLWSQMDELVGHYRRYSRDELCQKVSLAGFQILTCHYVDSIGFFAWLYLRYKGYKAGDAAGSDTSLKFFDKVLYPFSHVIDLLGCRYLFGKSLLLIAQKPTK